MFRSQDAYYVPQQLDCKNIQLLKIRPQAGSATRKPISKYSFLKPYFDYDFSETQSSQMAHDFERYIKETRKHKKETPQFVENILNKILYLHKYNLKVTEINFKYPLTKNFKQLLLRYIVLQCNVLYRREYFTPMYEITVGERILRLLLNVYNPYFENLGILPPNKIFEESAKAILKLLIQIKLEFDVQNKLIENIAKKLLNKLGKLESIMALEERCIPCPSDTYLNDPSIADTCKNIITSDYGTDDDLIIEDDYIQIDNEEQNDDSDNLDVDIKPEIIDLIRVSNRLQPNQDKSPKVPTIYIDDDDDVMVCWEAEAQKSSRSKKRDEAEKEKRLAQRQKQIKVFTNHRPMIPNNSNEMATDMKEELDDLALNSEDTSSSDLSSGNNSDIERSFLNDIVVIQDNSDEEHFSSEGNAELDNFESHCVIEAHNSKTLTCERIPQNETVQNQNKDTEMLQISNNNDQQDRNTENSLETSSTSKSHLDTDRIKLTSDMTKNAVERLNENIELAETQADTDNREALLIQKRNIEFEEQCSDVPHLNSEEGKCTKGQNYSRFGRASTKLSLDIDQNVDIDRTVVFLETSHDIETVIKDQEVNYEGTVYADKEKSSSSNVEEIKYNMLKGTISIDQCQEPSTLKFREKESKATTNEELDKNEDFQTTKKLVEQNICIIECNASRSAKEIESSAVEILSQIPISHTANAEEKYIEERNETVDDEDTELQKHHDTQNVDLCEKIIFEDTRMSTDVCGNLNDQVKVADRSTLQDIEKSVEPGIITSPMNKLQFDGVVNSIDNIQSDEEKRLIAGKSVKCRENYEVDRTASDTLVGAVEKSAMQNTAVIIEKETNEEPTIDYANEGKLKIFTEKSDTANLDTVQDLEILSTGEELITKSTDNIEVPVDGKVGESNSINSCTILNNVISCQKKLEKPLVPKEGSIERLETVGVAKTHNTERVTASDNVIVDERHTETGIEEKEKNIREIAIDDSSKSVNVNQHLETVTINENINVSQETAILHMSGEAYQEANTNQQVEMITINKNIPPETEVSQKPKLNSGEETFEESIKNVNTTVKEVMMEIEEKQNTTFGMDNVIVEEIFTEAIVEEKEKNVVEKSIGSINSVNVNKSLETVMINENINGSPETDISQKPKINSEKKTYGEYINDVNITVEDIEIEKKQNTTLAMDNVIVKEVCTDTIVEDTTIVEESFDDSIKNRNVNQPLETVIKNENINVSQETYISQKSEINTGEDTLKDSIDDINTPIEDVICIEKKQNKFFYMDSVIVEGKFTETAVDEKENNIVEKSLDDINNALEMVMPNENVNVLPETDISQKPEISSGEETYEDVINDVTTTAQDMIEIEKKQKTTLAMDNVIVEEVYTDTIIEDKNVEKSIDSSTSVNVNQPLETVIKNENIDASQETYISQKSEMNTGEETCKDSINLNTTKGEDVMHIEKKQNITIHADVGIVEGLYTETIIDEKKTVVDKSLDEIKNENLNEPLEMVTINETVNESEDIDISQKPKLNSGEKSINDVNTILGQDLIEIEKQQNAAFDTNNVPLGERRTGTIIMEEKSTVEKLVNDSNKSVNVTQLLETVTVNENINVTYETDLSQKPKLNSDNETYEESIIDSNTNLRQDMIEIVKIQNTDFGTDDVTKKYAEEIINEKGENITEISVGDSIESVSVNQPLETVVIKENIDVSQEIDISQKTTISSREETYKESTNDVNITIGQDIIEIEKKQNATSDTENVEEVHSETITEKGENIAEISVDSSECVNVNQPIETITINERIDIFQEADISQKPKLNSEEETYKESANEENTNLGQNMTESRTKHNAAFSADAVIGEEHIETVKNEKGEMSVENNIESVTVNQPFEVVTINENLNASWEKDSSQKPNINIGEETYKEPVDDVNTAIRQDITEVKNEQNVAFDTDNINIEERYTETVIGEKKENIEEISIDNSTESANVDQTFVTVTIKENLNVSQERSIAQILKINDGEETHQELVVELNTTTEQDMVEIKEKPNVALDTDNVNIEERYTETEIREKEENIEEMSIDGSIESANVDQTFETVTINENLNVSQERDIAQIPKINDVEETYLEPVVELNTTIEQDMVEIKEKQNVAFDTDNVEGRYTETEIREKEENITEISMDGSLERAFVDQTFETVTINENLNVSQKGDIPQKPKINNGEETYKEPVVELNSTVEQDMVEIKETQNEAFDANNFNIEERYTETVIREKEENIVEISIDGSIESAHVDQTFETVTINENLNVSQKGDIPQKPKINNGEETYEEAVVELNSTVEQDMVEVKETQNEAFDPNNFNIEERYTVTVIREKEENIVEISIDGSIESAHVDQTFETVTINENLNVSQKGDIPQKPKINNGEETYKEAVVELNSTVEQDMIEVKETQNEAFDANNFNIEERYTETVIREKEEIIVEISIDGSIESAHVDQTFETVTINENLNVSQKEDIPQKPKINNGEEIYKEPVVELNSTVEQDMVEIKETQNEAFDTNNFNIEEIYTETVIREKDENIVEISIDGSIESANVDQTFETVTINENLNVSQERDIPQKLKINNGEETYKEPVVELNSAVEQDVVENKETQNEAFDTDNFNIEERYTETVIIEKDENIAEISIDSIESANVDHTFETVTINGNFNVSQERDIPQKLKINNGEETYKEPVVELKSTVEQDMVEIKETQNEAFDANHFNIEEIYTETVIRERDENIVEISIDGNIESANVDQTFETVTINENLNVSQERDIPQKLKINNGEETYKEPVVELNSTVEQDMVEIKETQNEAFDTNNFNIEEIYTETVIREKDENIVELSIDGSIESANVDQTFETVTKNENLNVSQERDIPQKLKINNGEETYKEPVVELNSAVEQDMVEIKETQNEAFDTDNFNIEERNTETEIREKEENIAEISIDGSIESVHVDQTFETVTINENLNVSQERGNAQVPKIDNGEETYKESINDVSTTVRHDMIEIEKNQNVDTERVNIEERYIEAIIEEKGENISEKPVDDNIELNQVKSSEVSVSVENRIASEMLRGDITDKPVKVSATEKDVEMYNESIIEENVLSITKTSDSIESSMVDQCLELEVALNEEVVMTSEENVEYVSKPQELDILSHEAICRKLAEDKTSPSERKIEETIAPTEPIQGVVEIILNEEKSVEIAEEGIAITNNETKMYKDVEILLVNEATSKDLSQLDIEIIRSNYKDIENKELINNKSKTADCTIFNQFDNLTETEFINESNIQEEIITETFNVLESNVSEQIISENTLSKDRARFKHEKINVINCIPKAEISNSSQSVSTLNASDSMLEKMKDALKKIGTEIVEANKDAKVKPEIVQDLEICAIANENTPLEILASIASKVRRQDLLTPKKNKKCARRGKRRRSVFKNKGTVSRSKQPSKIESDFEQKCKPHDFVIINNSETPPPANNIYTQKLPDVSVTSEDSNDSEGHLLIDEDVDIKHNKHPKEIIEENRTTDIDSIPNEKLSLYDEDTFEEEIPFAYESKVKGTVLISIPDNDQANFEILKQMEEMELCSFNNLGDTTCKGDKKDHESIDNNASLYIKKDSSLTGKTISPINSEKPEPDYSSNEAVVNTDILEEMDNPIVEQSPSENRILEVNRNEVVVTDILEQMDSLIVQHPLSENKNSEVNKYKPFRTMAERKDYDKFKLNPYVSIERLNVCGKVKEEDRYIRTRSKSFDISIIRNSGKTYLDQNAVQLNPSNINTPKSDPKPKVCVEENIHVVLGTSENATETNSTCSQLIVKSPTHSLIDDNLPLAKLKDDLETRCDNVEQMDDGCLEVIPLLSKKQTKTKRGRRRRGRSLKAVKQKKNKVAKQTVEKDQTKDENMNKSVKHKKNRNEIEDIDKSMIVKTRLRRKSSLDKLEEVISIHTISNNMVLSETDSKPTTKSGSKDFSSAMITDVSLGKNGGPILKLENEHKQNSLTKPESESKLYIKTLTKLEENINTNEEDTVGNSNRKYYTTPKLRRKSMSKDNLNRIERNSVDVVTMDSLNSSTTSDEKRVPFSADKKYYTPPKLRRKTVVKNENIDIKDTPKKTIQKQFKPATSKVDILSKCKNTVSPTTEKLKKKLEIDFKLNCEGIMYDTIDNFEMLSRKSTENNVKSVEEADKECDIQLSENIISKGGLKPNKKCKSKNSVKLSDGDTSTTANQKSKINHESSLCGTSTEKTIQNDLVHFDKDCVSDQNVIIEEIVEHSEISYESPLKIALEIDSIQPLTNTKQQEITSGQVNEIERISSDIELENILQGFSETDKSEKILNISEQSIVECEIPPVTLEQQSEVVLEKYSANISDEINVKLNSPKKADSLVCASSIIGNKVKARKPTKQMETKNEKLSRKLQIMLPNKEIQNLSLESDHTCQTILDSACDEEIKTSTNEGDDSVNDLDSVPLKDRASKLIDLQDSITKPGRKGKIKNKKNRKRSVSVDMATKVQVDEKISALKVNMENKIPIEKATVDKIPFGNIQNEDKFDTTKCKDNVDRNETNVKQHTNRDMCVEINNFENKTDKKTIADNGKTQKRQIIATDKKLVQDNSRAFKKNEESSKICKKIKETRKSNADKPKTTQIKTRSTCVLEDDHQNITTTESRPKRTLNVDRIKEDRSKSTSKSTSNSKTVVDSSRQEHDTKLSEKSYSDKDGNKTYCESKSSSHSCASTSSDYVQYKHEKQKDGSRDRNHKTNSRSSSVSSHSSSKPSTPSSELSGKHESRKHDKSKYRSSSMSSSSSSSKCATPGTLGKERYKHRDHEKSKSMHNRSRSSRSSYQMSETLLVSSSTSKKITKKHSIDKKIVHSESNSVSENLCKSSKTELKVDIANVDILEAEDDISKEKKTIKKKQEERKKGESNTYSEQNEIPSKRRRTGKSDIKRNENSTDELEISDRKITKSKIKKSELYKSEENLKLSTECISAKLDGSNVIKVSVVQMNDKVKENNDTPTMYDGTLNKKDIKLKPDLEKDKYCQEISSKIQRQDLDSLRMETLIETNKQNKLEQNSNTVRRKKTTKANSVSVKHLEKNHRNYPKFKETLIANKEYDVSQGNLYKSNTILTEAKADLSLSKKFENIKYDSNFRIIENISDKNAVESPNLNPNLKALQKDDLSQEKNIRPNDDNVKTAEAICLEETVKSSESLNTEDANGISQVTQINDIQSGSHVLHKDLETDYPAVITKDITNMESLTTDKLNHIIDEKTPFKLNQNYRQIEEDKISSPSTVSLIDNNLNKASEEIFLAPSMSLNEEASKLDQNMQETKNSKNREVNSVNDLTKVIKVESSKAVTKACTKIAPLHFDDEMKNINNKESSIIEQNSKGIEQCKIGQINVHLNDDNFSKKSELKCVEITNDVRNLEILNVEVTDTIVQHSSDLKQNSEDIEKYDIVQTSIIPLNDNLCKVLEVASSKPFCAEVFKSNNEDESMEYKCVQMNSISPNVDNLNKTSVEDVTNSKLVNAEINESDVEQAFELKQSSQNIDGYKIQQTNSISLNDDNSSKMLEVKCLEGATNAEVNENTIEKTSNGQQNSEEIEDYKILHTNHVSLNDEDSSKMSIVKCSKDVTNSGLLNADVNEDIVENASELTQSSGEYKMAQTNLISLNEEGSSKISEVTCSDAIINSELLNIDVSESRAEQISELEQGSEEIEKHTIIHTNLISPNDGNLSKVSEVKCSENISSVSLNIEGNESNIEEASDLQHNLKETREYKIVQTNLVSLNDHNSNKVSEVKCSDINSETLNKPNKNNFEQVSDLKESTEKMRECAVVQINPVFLNGANLTKIPEVKCWEEIDTEVSERTQSSEVIQKDQISEVSNLSVRDDTAHGLQAKNLIENIKDHAKLKSLHVENIYSEKDCSKLGQPLKIVEMKNDKIVLESCLEATENLSELPLVKAPEDAAGYLTNLQLLHLGDLNEENVERSLCKLPEKNTKAVVNNELIVCENMLGKNLETTDLDKVDPASKLEGITLASSNIANETVKLDNEETLKENEESQITKMPDYQMEQNKNNVYMAQFSKLKYETKMANTSAQLQEHKENTCLVVEGNDKISPKEKQLQKEREIPISNVAGAIGLKHKNDLEYISVNNNMEIKTIKLENEKITKQNRGSQEIKQIPDYATQQNTKDAYIAAKFSKPKFGNETAESTQEDANLVIKEAANPECDKLLSEDNPLQEGLSGHNLIENKHKKVYGREVKLKNIEDAFEQYLPTKPEDKTSTANVIVNVQDKPTCISKNTDLSISKKRKSTALDLGHVSITKQNIPVPEVPIKKARIEKKSYDVSCAIQSSGIKPAKTSPLFISPKKKERKSIEVIISNLKEEKSNNSNLNEDTIKSESKSSNKISCKLLPMMKYSDQDPDELIKDIIPNRENNATISLEPVSENVEINKVVSDESALSLSKSENPHFDMDDSSKNILNFPRESEPIVEVDGDSINYLSKKFNTVTGTTRVKYNIEIEKKSKVPIPGIDTVTSIAKDSLKPVTPPKQTNCNANSFLTVQSYTLTKDALPTKHVGLEKQKVIENSLNQVDGSFINDSLNIPSMENDIIGKLDSSTNRESPNLLNLSDLMHIDSTPTNVANMEEIVVANDAVCMFPDIISTTITSPENKLPCSNSAGTIKLFTYPVTSQPDKEEFIPLKDVSTSNNFLDDTNVATGKVESLHESYVFCSSEHARTLSSPCLGLNLEDVPFNNIPISSTHLGLICPKSLSRSSNFMNEVPVGNEISDMTEITCSNEPDDHNYTLGPVGGPLLSGRPEQEHKNISSTTFNKISGEPLSGRPEQETKNISLTTFNKPLLDDSPNEFSLNDVPLQEFSENNLEIMVDDTYEVNLATEYAVEKLVSLGRQPSADTNAFSVSNYNMADIETINLIECSTEENSNSKEYLDSTSSSIEQETQSLPNSTNPWAEFIANENPNQKVVVLPNEQLVPSFSFTKNEMMESFRDKVVNSDDKTVQGDKTVEMDTAPISSSVSESCLAQNTSNVEKMTVNASRFKANVRKNRKTQSEKPIQKDNTLNDFLSKRRYSKTLLRPKKKNAPVSFINETKKEAIVETTSVPEVSSSSIVLNEMTTQAKPLVETNIVVTPTEKPVLEDGKVVELNKCIQLNPELIIEEKNDTDFKIRPMIGLIVPQYNKRNSPLQSNSSLVRDKLDKQSIKTKQKSSVPCLSKDLQGRGNFQPKTSEIKKSPWRSPREDLLQTTFTNIAKVAENMDVSKNSGNMPIKPHAQSIADLVKSRVRTATNKYPNNYSSPTASATRETNIKTTDTPKPTKSSSTDKPRLEDEFNNFVIENRSKNDLCQPAQECKKISQSQLQVQKSPARSTTANSIKPFAEPESKGNSSSQIHANNQRNTTQDKSDITSTNTYNLTQSIDHLMKYDLLSKKATTLSTTPAEPPKVAKSKYNYSIDSILSKDSKSYSNNYKYEHSVKDYRQPKNRGIKRNSSAIEDERETGKEDSKRQRKLDSTGTPQGSSNEDAIFDELRQQGNVNRLICLKVTEDNKLKPERRSSPLLTDRSSPLSKDRRSSPLSKDRRNSPLSVDKRRSPLSADRRNSPLSAGKRHSPLTTERRNSPLSTERRNSPLSIEKRKSPLSIEKRNSPLSIQRKNSPLQKSHAKEHNGKEDKLKSGTRNSPLVTEQCNNSKELNKSDGINLRLENSPLATNSYNNKGQNQKEFNHSRSSVHSFDNSSGGTRRDREEVKEKRPESRSYNPYPYSTKKTSVRESPIDMCRIQEEYNPDHNPNRGRESHQFGYNRGRGHQSVHGRGREGLRSDASRESFSPDQSRGRAGPSSDSKERGQQSYRSRGSSRQSDCSQETGRQSDRSRTECHQSGHSRQQHFDQPSTSAQSSNVSQPPTRSSNVSALYYSNPIGRPNNDFSEGPFGKGFTKMNQEERIAFIQRCQVKIVDTLLPHQSKDDGEYSWIEKFNQRIQSDGYLLAPNASTPQFFAKPSP